jgi:hypothetical protein
MSNWAFPAPPEAVKAGLMQQLPGYIAEHSWCSCGQLLEVADQNMSLNAGVGTFNGKFRCPRCTTSVKGRFNAMVASIKSIWGSIRKIKIGADGIEFEKTATESSEKKKNK